MRIWTMALMLAAVSACSGTTISASNYPQACALDGECTGVFQGDACQQCGCPNAGVLASAADRYNKDLAALRMQCGAQTAIACAPCTPVRGLCINKTCSMRPE